MEQQPQHESITVRSIQRHQFSTLIIGSILISLFLVYVAVSLYQSSGTLQLDLSRPGYDSARKEATKGSEVFQAFPANGEIDEAVLNEFSDLYREKAIEALSVDAFSGDSLGDKALLLE